MTFRNAQTACQAAGLEVVAAFHPTAALRPEGARTLLLLGPREPGFWARVQADPAFCGPNPLDHWSESIVTELASTLGARALFPFGDPPRRFVSWALASGQVWQSPVGLLVDNGAGLFVSFRGALAFDTALPLPPNTRRSPCLSCADQPCRDACPVGALGPTGYDLSACHGWLDKSGGETCLFGGCLVRRACPVAQSYGRLKQQSAHHMRFFHKG